MKPDPLAPPGADLSQAILGTWNLVSREDYDREGRRIIDPMLGPDPLGMLCFATRHFAAQFMNRRRAASVGSAAGATASTAMPANNSSAVDGYDAYFGTYNLDAGSGTIQIALEGAIAPANIGLKLTREIRVTGGRLLIRLSTTAADGTPITRTLTFERAT